MNVSHFVVGTALLGAIGAGTKVADLKETITPKGQYTGLEAHETHASASLLGQFRTSVSGWLWVRTDLYLHNGVEMRPLTEAEINLGRTGVGNNEGDHSIMDDSKIVTVIPSRDRDFRGIFGDIERATKAYKDMTNHSHNNPKQALPLFRLMTILDPNFVPGWSTGAAVLALGKDKPSYVRAVEFLKEGLEHNPKSVSIWNQLGFTYTARLHDYPKATHAFEEAVKSGEAVQLAILSEDDQESLQYAYRWLALMYRESGDLKNYYTTLRKGLKKFPADIPMERMLNRPPLVLAHPKAAPTELEAKPNPIEEEHAHDDHEDHHGHEHHSD